jgi:hypothetical protein
MRRAGRFLPWRAPAHNRCGTNTKGGPCGPPLCSLAERAGLIRLLRNLTLRAASLRSAVCRRASRASARTPAGSSTHPHLMIRKREPFRPPFSDHWRRGRDSNPRYGVTVNLLSKQAPSTARPPLRISFHCNQTIRQTRSQSGSSAGQRGPPVLGAKDFTGAPLALQRVKERRGSARSLSANPLGHPSRDSSA